MKTPNGIQNLQNSGLACYGSLICENKTANLKNEYPNHKHYRSSTKLLKEPPEGSTDKIWKTLTLKHQTPLLKNLSPTIVFSSTLAETKAKSCDSCGLEEFRNRKTFWDDFTNTFRTKSEMYSKMNLKTTLNINSQILLKMKK